MAQAEEPSLERLAAQVAPHPAIVAALDAIPKAVLDRSGSVFYSGRAAFAAPSRLYIVGLNPGGDPLAQAAETVGAHRQRFCDGQPWWSEYADESWRGAKPGEGGMQPRVLHMIARLGLDARAIPASNVVFIRSSTEATLNSEKSEMLRLCWPVHHAVIEALGVQVVLCFGSTAGRWVREALGARTCMDFYVEENARQWRSEAHRADNGRVVVTLTHPGRANWCNAQSDPTPLVQQALAAVRV